MTEPVKYTPDIEHSVDREEDLTREILAQMGASQRRAAGEPKQPHLAAKATSHAFLKPTPEVHECALIHILRCRRTPLCVFLRLQYTSELNHALE
ncbi:hypothetical protein NGH33_10230, partial [Micrococcus yunnanensis]|nr:hypothetical protein [Micrococcus yunnanensis]